MRSHRNKVKALYEILEPHQAKLLEGLKLTPLEQSIFSHHRSGEDSYSLSELATTLRSDKAAISRASVTLLYKILSALNSPSSIEHLQLLQRAGLQAELHHALEKQSEASMTLSKQEQEEYIGERITFMSWVPDDRVVTKLMGQFVDVLSHHHTLD